MYPIILLTQFSLQMSTRLLKSRSTFFCNSSMLPCESRRNSNYPQSCRYSESAFIQIKQATFLPPDSDFCMLLWNITVCYFPLFADWFQSFFDFFFLNLSVFYAWALFFCEHLSIWHSRGVVLLMRPGDYVLPGDALIPVSHIQHRRLLSG